MFKTTCVTAIGLAAGILLAAPPAPAEPGFTTLFNGKDLTGWRLVEPEGRGYIVENGLLECPADGGGNLFTEREYANFVFRFEFKLEEGSNNGMAFARPMKVTPPIREWRSRSSTTTRQSTAENCAPRNITGPFTT